MKVELLYEKNVVVLPSSVMPKIDQATKRDLKILFVLASSPEKRESIERYSAELAAAAGCSEQELYMSIAFWRGTGVLETDDREAVETKTDKKPPEKKKKVDLSDELPKYTTAELNVILSAQEEAALLVDESQRAFGKIFNPHEIGILLGLRDYFGFNSDYILILLDHCNRMGKKSLHYVKKRAFSLYDAPEKKKKVDLSDELPKYTTAELNVILSAQEEAALLVDESQRAFGKIFNPHEIGILLGLRDYFGFNSDYILILLDHCNRMGKKSLHYVKKRAFSLYDEGITDPEVLHEHLLRLEASATVEGEIRRMFGIRDRQLTDKEKKFIAKWTGEFAYPVEVIKKAYETTVDAIGKPSFAYADAIIERWYAAGLRDLAAIEAADSEKLPIEGSFDTNDFFESALRRSFGETNKSEV